MIELKMEALPVSHDVEAYGYTITNEDGERVMNLIILIAERLLT